MPSPVFSCMAQVWGVRFPCRPFSSEAARDAFPKPPSSRKATERAEYPLKPASGPYLPPDGGARSVRRRNPTHRSHCTCRPKKNAVRPGGAQGAGETPTGTTGFPPAAGRQHPRVRRIPSVSINNVLLLRKNKRVRRMYLKPFSPRAGFGRGRKRERERERERERAVSVLFVTENAWPECPVRERTVSGVRAEGRLNGRIPVWGWTM